MPKANITSSTIEKKDNTMPSAANLINMISGIYTSPLWEEVRYYASSLATLRKIQKAIATQSSTAYAAVDATARYNPLFLVFAVLYCP